MATVEPSYWCERVQHCFFLFLAQPHSLQHLLLFGPPGSGKTTSAAWLVDKIWGNRKSLMCISMNAADERSLESIRQKVFPFLEVDWRTEEETAPRFLILDECETLTEAAQLSLQTMLNTDPREVCVILICNSQSRIHPKLRQRLLKIRYDPPPRGTQPPTLTHALTRGDLRQMDRQADTEDRIWRYLHTHPSALLSVLRTSAMDEMGILSEILLLADHFEVLDAEIVEQINLMYPIVAETTLLRNVWEKHLLLLLTGLKGKIERRFVEKGGINHRTAHTDGV